MSIKSEKTKFFFSDKEALSFNSKKEVIVAIEDAKRQWNTAWEYFNLVSEPKLIDYAIYMEQAAKIRYMYLLSEAREKGISVAI